MYVTFYRGNKLEKKSYYTYQKSLYYPTVQRMKCRSVVLGYLGTQDQSYFISVLSAARTAKSTGTADDDQFKKDLKSIHFKNTVTRSSFDSKPKPWMTFFNNTSADIKTKSSHDPVVVMKLEFENWKNVSIFQI